MVKGKKSPKGRKTIHFEIPDYPEKILNNMADTNFEHKTRPNLYRVH
jgi:hypothetical protein